jgi:hypothetical protein
MSLDRRTFMSAALGAIAAAPLRGIVAATVSKPTESQSMPHCCPIVELRQYTLHRNRRDDLIELFDRTFIEPQEVQGMRVIGQFRDLDDPDRFVWLRGFDDMERRREALAAFYGGPVWAAHRDAANATMLDSDNVLLLHPSRTGDGFALPPRSDGDAASVITATLHYLEAAQVPAFVDFFEQVLRPRFEADGAKVLASFVSETAENSFPRLPVRSGEHVMVWFARFDDVRAQAAFAERRRRDSGWRDTAPESLLPAFMRKPEVLRLAPTRRSALR